MRRLPSRVRERLRHMIGAGEEPSRLAASWALGFAVAFSPFIGLHWVIAVLTAHAMRLNKVDAVLGTLVINPWTYTLYFPGAVLLGRFLTGIEVPAIVLPSPAQLLSLEFWRMQGDWMRPLILAWIAGSTVAMIVVGAGSFLLLRAALERHRQKVHGTRDVER